jgi:recombination protein RecR
VDYLPERLKNAVDEIARLPGIGKKSALRITLGLMKWDASQLNKLTNGLGQLLEIQKCKCCGSYSDEETCYICKSTSRSNGVLCVVEDVTDLGAIENSGQFKGKYHITHGVLNPLLGIGPDQLNLDSLVKRIDLEGITELILALNPSVEGDATCSYIRSILDAKVSISRIGFGVPIGGSLEYLDPLTISKAFENKKSL